MRSVVVDAHVNYLICIVVLIGYLGSRAPTYYPCVLSLSVHILSNSFAYFREGGPCCIFFEYSKRLNLEPQHSGLFSEVKKGRKMKQLERNFDRVLEKKCIFQLLPIKYYIDSSQKECILFFIARN